MDLEPRNVEKVPEVAPLPTVAEPSLEPSDLQPAPIKELERPEMNSNKPSERENELEKPAENIPRDGSSPSMEPKPAVVKPSTMESLAEEEPAPQATLLAPESSPQQQKQQQIVPAEEPKAPVATISTVTTRPMRQSRLRHRNFDLELELLEDDEVDVPRRQPQRKRGKSQIATNTPVDRFGPPKLPDDTRAEALQSTGFPQRTGMIGRGVYTRTPVQRHELPRVLDFCIIDMECPRKKRSDVSTRPRSSRASINRLKQAAHGNLPLGGDPSTVFLGRMSPAASHGGASEEDSDRSDSRDDREEGSRRRSEKRRRRHSKPSSGTRDWREQQQQQQQHHLNSGPSPQQRKLMDQIANAPPHMRQTMLQRLMQDQLGVPAKSPASLAALPRNEQHAIVHQLMSDMAPHQRHSLLHMPAQQQASFLQQYYHERILPQRQMGPSVIKPDPILPVQPPLPPAANPSESQQHLRNLLLKLTPQQQAQLATLPREQQQALLMRLLQQTGPQAGQSVPPFVQPQLGSGGGVGFQESPSGPVPSSSLQAGPRPSGSWKSGTLDASHNAMMLPLTAPGPLLGSIAKDGRGGLASDLFGGDPALTGLVGNGPRADELQDAVNLFLN